jgi:hypothetical protein
MCIRCVLFIVMMLCGPVWADRAALMARADQAFAAGEYATALSIYRTLEPDIQDADQRAFVQEKIRVGERFASDVQSNKQPATQPVAVSAESGRSSQTNLQNSVVPQPRRTAHIAPAAGETLELTLHTLGNFEYDENKNTSLPDDVKALSGAHIRIQGQMLPLEQAGRVTRFLLINDLMSCCFGQAPKLQQVMMIQLPEDKWIEPTSERLLIEGTLTVEVKKEDGFVVSLFELTPSSIKYAPQ